MKLDEETIKKILLYNKYKNLTEIEIKKYITELQIINKMYKRKINKYKKYIEKHTKKL